MEIIAHRGGKETPFQPNTKEALLYALKQKNIDGVECDLRITKDKKIVIIHDSIINFVSNGSGLVKFLPLRKLYRYNFGNEKYASKISTLDAFLKQVKSSKKLLLELKEESKDFQEYAYQVYRIIHKYPQLNISIISFHYELLKYFRDHYHYPCGLIIGLGQNTDKLYNHFDFNIVTYPYKDRVSHNKETFLWTINQKKQDLSSFSIITDYPNRLTE